MRIEDIKAAEAGALRFCRAIDDLFSREETEAKRDFPSRVSALYGSRESGAVRRASMDLTRALAKLRRS
uniref:Uncharacterized protein n=1 Tax=viral metagenome TaxID=1070528 RepID=A0A6M3KMF5_9ZZZZ